MSPTPPARHTDDSPARLPQRPSQQHERVVDNSNNSDYTPPTPSPTRSLIPLQQRLLSPNELSYYLPSRAFGMNDMYLCLEFFAAPSLMTPSRLLLAWTILRLRHPLIASRIIMTRPRPEAGASVSELEAYYRSASYALDPPSSPADALTQSLNSLTLDHINSPRRRSEDLCWEYNNGPRTLSSEHLVTLQFYRALSKNQRASTSSLSAHRSPTGTGTDAGAESGEKREQYIVILAEAHCVLDGLATFMLSNELFELMGGASATSTYNGYTAPSSGYASGSSEFDGKTHGKASQPRSEAQLRALLRSEWALRYGPASALRAVAGSVPSPRSGTPAPSLSSGGLASGHLPASFEERVAPEHDPMSARDDFVAEQARFLGGHAFARASKSKSASPSGGAPPSPHADPQRPISETTRTPSITNRHQVQRDIVWPEATARRILSKCKKNGVSVQCAMFAVANIAWLRMQANAAERKRMERKGPTLMYTAVNLRPLVGHHAYAENERRVRAAMPVPPSPGFVALGYFNVMLPEDLPSSGSSPSALTPSPVRTAAKSEHDDFWGRAREAKKQQNTAVRSERLISRNVLMGVERGDRAVKFAMEDDGYIKRPSATPVPLLSASPATHANPPPPPPATALLGMSLLGSADSLYHYENYPSITPTQCRCGTRKAFGGILLFTFSFRGALYVSIGWDEKGFANDSDPEHGVGVRAFLKQIRSVVAQFLVDDLAECPKDGVDVSGDERLEEWNDPLERQRAPLSNPVGGGILPQAEMAKL